MSLDHARHLFIQESRELLQDMESALLALAEAGHDNARVDAIFRAAHTIKGSAGLFGLESIVAFTHVLENMLARVREDREPVDAPQIDLLLSCGDHIGALVDLVESGVPGPDEALLARGGELLHQLHALGPETETASAILPSATGTGLANRASQREWHVSVRFGQDTFRHGMDPLSFLCYLGRLGTLRTLEVIPDARIDDDAMDPESCHLGFDIHLLSEADHDTLENVFEFVRDESKVSVTLQGKSPEPNARPSPRQVEEASARPRSVRVDADKLDKLIDLVGELIIATAGTQLEARRSRMPALMERSSILGGLVESVRDSALQLRMIKIGGVFRRFQRLVYDVSQDLGKDIALDLRGEDTELDKTLVEQLSDPLTHLVRNAMDHGIEPAEQRLAAGKPARGEVRLDAFHESGHIVIEVSDDGGGLRRERILAKAIERGLVEPTAQLDDEEIFQLIFEPGFSTAEQVTNLSGRGVGMDVVKRNIAALRGNVSVRSEAGRGTTFSIRLPLTLAIIDGFMVGVAGAVFVIPLEMVEECIEYSAEPGHDYTNLRGEVLPFISLRQYFHLGQTPSARQNIVIVNHAGLRFGLVVDALLGEFQTVVKPLGKMFEHLGFISGSTILGNGEVALILDVPAMSRKAQTSTPQHHSSSPVPA